MDGAPVTAEIVVSPDRDRTSTGSTTSTVTDIAAAIALARIQGSAGSRIRIRPGRYRIERPIGLDQRDSGLLIEAADGPGSVQVYGSIPVTSWRETRLHGRRVWAADIPQAAAPHSLFAAGRRLPRPRLPRVGRWPITGQDGLDLGAGPFERLYDGADRFRFDPATLPEAVDGRHVDVVVPHYWVQERMPVLTIDRAAAEIRCSRRSIFALRKESEPSYADFYLDNVRAALGEVEGEWYAEPEAGRIWYVPHPGDEISLMHAELPVTDQLLRIAGTADGPVDEVTVCGLDFAYADWRQPARPQRFGIPEDDLLPADVPVASAPQAAADIGGAVTISHARGIRLRACTVRHVGGYGIELGAGAQGCEIGGCRLEDLGAGGISLDGDDRGGGGAGGACTTNYLHDNRILAAGHVFPQGVGILIRRSTGNRIEHNEVADLHYTAISCGWSWGYGASVADGNVIVANHLHHVGLGMLSDLAGIYVLGPQPSTRVTGNLVHDVTGASYGGWGLYLDEGATGVTMSHNVVHAAGNEDLHLHYGRDNVVHNNLLGGGRTGTVSVQRTEPHRQLELRRNVAIAHPRRPLGPGLDERRDGVSAHANLVVPVGSDAPAPGTRRFDPAGSEPARRLGIEPIDVTDAGPRPGTPQWAGTDAAQPRHREGNP